MFLVIQLGRCLLTHLRGSQDMTKSIFTGKVHISALYTVVHFGFGNGIICSATEKLEKCLFLNVPNGWNAENWDLNNGWAIKRFAKKS